MFLNLLADSEEANKAFCAAVQFNDNSIKSWSYWGDYFRTVFMSSKLVVALQFFHMHFWLIVLKNSYLPSNLSFLYNWIDCRIRDWPGVTETSWRELNGRNVGFLIGRYHFIAIWIIFHTTYLNALQKLKRSFFLNCHAVINCSGTKSKPIIVVECFVFMQDFSIDFNPLDFLIFTWLIAPSAYISSSNFEAIKKACSPLLPPPHTLATAEAGHNRIEVPLVVWEQFDQH